jgi:hypothetical protein
VRSWNSKWRGWGIDATSRYHLNIFLIRRNKITKQLCLEGDFPTWIFLNLKMVSYTSSWKCVTRFNRQEYNNWQLIMSLCRLYFPFHFFPLRWKAFFFNASPRSLPYCPSWRHIDSPRLYTQLHEDGIKKADVRRTAGNLRCVHSYTSFIRFLELCGLRFIYIKYTAKYSFPTVQ